MSTTEVNKKAQLEQNLITLKAKVYDLNMMQNQLTEQINLFNNQIVQTSTLIQQENDKEAEAKAALEKAAEAKVAEVAAEIAKNPAPAGAVGTTTAAPAPQSAAADVATPADNGLAKKA